MTTEELRQLIAEKLADFYQRRMLQLGGLKLRKVLSRKNPYLFKAIGTKSATDLIEGLLNAYLSSSDESIFGDAFFEPIAKAVSGGVVSPSEGVDVAIETETVYKAISVKSGPNPYNSSQRKRQDQEFRALRSRLVKLKKEFDAILGHAYGRKSAKPPKSVIYRSIAGQVFWEELTGDADFYAKLVGLMEVEVIAKHRQTYEVAWANAVNRYVREFTNEFCDDGGAIQWEVLVNFNSGSKRIRRK